MIGFAALAELREMARKHGVSIVESPENVVSSATPPPDVAYVMLLSKIMEAALKNDALAEEFSAWWQKMKDSGQVSVNRVM